MCTADGGIRWLVDRKDVKIISFDEALVLTRNSHVNRGVDTKVFLHVRRDQCRICNKEQ